MLLLVSVGVVTDEGSAGVDEGGRTKETFFVSLIPFRLDQSLRPSFSSFFAAFRSRNRFGSHKENRGELTLLSVCM